MYLLLTSILVVGAVVAVCLGVGEAIYEAWKRAYHPGFVRDSSLVWPARYQGAVRQKSEGLSRYEASRRGERHTRMWR